MIHDAIILQQRIGFLIQHPIFGALAAPLRDIAKPFVETYNDLLRQLDQQLPSIDTTHRMRLNPALSVPPNLEEFPAIYENYIARFGLDRADPSSNSDLIKERFYIARGEQVLGEFGRAAIADNLSGQLFVPDDLYWSDELQQWQPLSCLPVAALQTNNP